MSISSNHSNLSVKKLNNLWPLARQVIRSQVNFTLPYPKRICVARYLTSCDKEQNNIAPEITRCFANASVFHTPCGPLLCSVAFMTRAKMVKHFLTFYTQIFYFSTYLFRYQFPLKG